MEELIHTIKFGLEPLPADDRDFSHNEKYGTLGAAQVQTIPDFTIYDAFQYSVAWGDTIYKICNKFHVTVQQILLANPKISNINKIYTGQVITIPARTPIILNQLDLDFCTGFATTGIQDAMWGTENDPYYQFAKIKQTRGEYTQYGANVRDGANSVVKYGSLQKIYAPYKYNGKPAAGQPDRDFLANWNNYPKQLDMYARSEDDLSYFKIDGPNTAFQNILSTLYMHRQERRAISFGLFWHSAWTEAAGGIIPSIMPNDADGGGHNMFIVGKKTINSIPYLILQQSWGDTAGDKGFYYFQESIINLCVNEGYGMFAFSNVDASGLKTSGLMTTFATFINRIFGNI